MNEYPPDDSESSMRVFGIVFVWTFGLVVGLILGVWWYATTHNYDLEGAFKEKNAYNRERLDHKPEARLQENGKKW